MKWKKASPALLETFHRLVPQVAGVEIRKMFGYPCSFLNGHMFMGCHQENDLILRLSEQDRQAFLGLRDARPFEPMPGRVMKDYVVVPEWMLDDQDQLEQWVARSLSYTSSLPPKEGKRKAKARQG